MATRKEVVEYLRVLKQCVMLDRLHVMNRSKNRQSLLDLGISAQQRRDVLLGLVPEDYVAGPEPDRSDGAKEVWKFGKDVEGESVYIKLRVVEDPKKRGVYHATIWSFHPAEFPMKHPLRGGGS